MTSEQKKKLQIKLQEVIALRQQAYQQLFPPESVFAVRVLEDLAKFCRADESTFHADPRVHAVLEGRREVWLRIQDQLKLSSDELMDKYGRKDLK